jgi:hypothetical protein
MRRVICFMLVLFLPVISIADPGDIIWQRDFGRSGEYDGANSVCASGDGCYVIGGRSEYWMTDNHDFFLLKFSTDGDTLWSRTYGGDEFENARCVEITSDGGYVLAGYTGSFGMGGYDFYLVKTDSDGNLLWDRAYGGQNNDMGYAVRQTADGGFIMVGQTASFGGGAFDFYMVRTDSNGDTIWTATYGGNGNEMAYSVEVMPDGGFIVLGSTPRPAPGSEDILLVKIDSNGTLEWVKSYGANNYDSWIAYSIRPTLDGNFILGGYIWTPSLGQDALLMKIDVNGDSIWTRTYGTFDGWEEMRSARQARDGTFILAGSYTEPIQWDLQFLLIKADIDGNLLWTENYGGDRDDQGSDVVPTPQGDYIIVGNSESFPPGDQQCYALKIEGETRLTINMIPDNPPVVVNPGGSFTYTGQLSNNTAVSVPVDAWVMLDVPGYGIFGPIKRYDNIALNANQTISIDGIIQNVPYYAPYGDYDYLSYCGAYPNFIEDSASFGFSVVAPAGRGPNEWILSGWFDTGNEVPGRTALLNNCPDPFNAVTTISFDLQRPGNVRLEVYNLMGQRVATLVDGRIGAGQHEVRWDASPYSSGIYFYRLTTSDGTFARRMALLK